MITQQDCYLEIPHETTYSEWSNYFKTLDKLERGRQWYWGDWYRFGEHRFRAQEAQILPEGYPAWKTIQNAAFVCGVFPLTGKRIRPNLWFTHFSEVAGLKDSRVREKLLDIASQEKWTTARLREEVQRIRDSLGALITTMPEPVDDETLGDLRLRYQNRPAHIIARLIATIDGLRVKEAQP